MSGSIKIDYENMPLQSRNIRKQGEEINNKLLVMYKKVAEMHTYWYGKRYNELVIKFNELVPKLNQFLNLIIGEIPYMYEKIANNISNVDVKQNVTNAQKSETQKLEIIPIMEDVGMRYIEKDVKDISNQIIKILQETQDIIENTKKTEEQVNLECDGSLEFKNQFINVLNVFQNVLNNMETKFIELMEQDRAVMEEAEEDNFVE